ncbi:uncharacterized protein LOC113847623 [Abrus precatorius]|uniref:Uncharacterized protein LOC113847623 n=1 Tax=Abrus precatorius TaxID=3816 RepID=A0A8B8JMZ5_ABRPR|nr:uncharacterized protein LOC113847623 [Abrus precatorius]
MEQVKYTIVQVDNKGLVDEFDLVGSSSSDSGISSGSSLDSDSFEEVTSPASSSSSSSSAADQLATESLNDMSCLFQQLPIKRGLSKYYQGKAQSFTSLAKVRSLEDLVKPENPYNKKLKFCRSYGGGMGVISRHGSQSHKGLHSSGSRDSCSSLNAKGDNDNNFMSSRPPIPPHRSTSSTTIPNQTALFV